jgi:hypothetical protein
LVNAIQQTAPDINSTSVSPALVDLARNCLCKKPEDRRITPEHCADGGGGGG